MKYMLFALCLFSSWKDVHKQIQMQAFVQRNISYHRLQQGGGREWAYVWSLLLNSFKSTVENYLLAVCECFSQRTRTHCPTRECCSCPLVFRGWQWQRRCSGAQVAGLAVSSARSWCVLATLHNHISPLSEQQGCCAAQQQRQQQQHELLELGGAAPDLLTESFALISPFSFGCHLVRVYSCRCKGCRDDYYHYCWSY